jgi:hypothetical protein
MSKSNLKSFVDQFVAAVEGDNAKVLAEKTFRQRKSALTSHISSYQGDTMDHEDAVTLAKEALASARINNGVAITDRGNYITQLLLAKDVVVDAEETLAAHIEVIEFLQSEQGE